MVELSPRDISLARDTWAEAEKDIDGTGVVLFTELFSNYPDYIQYFDRLKAPGEEDLFKSQKFREHINNVILPALSEMLRNLENEAALKEQLLLLGKNHRERKLNRSHFENIKQVIVKTLEIRLGDAFTEEIKDAWVKVLTAGFNIVYVTLESETA